MAKITKSQKNSAVVFSVVMILTIGVLAPSIATVAYASSWSDFFDGDGNSIEQSISQFQESEQDSQVESGGNTDDSGNNFNFQNQNNTGSNVAGQSN